jgi:hypothetical protein
VEKLHEFSLIDVGLAAVLLGIAVAIVVKAFDRRKPWVVVAIVGVVGAVLVIGYARVTRGRYEQTGKTVKVEVETGNVIDDTAQTASAKVRDSK